MKKLYFLLFAILTVSISFSQGTETFDNFAETGSSYATGTFIGQDGSTWNYVQSRGDQTITGKSIMLGRNRTPQAEVYSGTISGGVGTISFNYQQAFSTNVNLNVLVNDIVMGTVTSSGEAGITKASGTITVNQPGDVVIKFSNPTGGGQVTIDDVVWTAYSGAATPVLSITSPSDGASFSSGTTNVDVSISVANFAVGDPGDGHIHWTIDSGSGPMSQSMKYDVLDESITVTDGGSYIVYMELVDNVNHLPFDPAVNATVSFSVAYPCDLQIGTITETCDNITTATDDTYNVTIAYTGGGTSQYTIDTEMNGTVGGDDPTNVPAGTITITGITEGVDFTATFTGNPTDSGCNITRSINSPNCDPQLTLPLYESFSYADGSLVGNSDWASHSGTAGDLVISSGQALVQHGAPSEDVNLPFTSVTGNVYYAFDMVVIDAGVPIGTGGTDFEYFAHFKDSGSGFVAQLDIVAPSGGGDYTLGISSDQNVADATWAADLTYGTSYRVTVRYDQDAFIAELWVDATSESDTSILGADEADPGDIAASFALRQSDSSENEGILVDNLAITQTFAETLSSQDVTVFYNFKIYPNPTSTGFVTITSNNSDSIQAQVFDILGKQVINNAISNNRLNVSSLNAGIYIVKLTQDNASVTKKLIIK